MREVRVTVEPAMAASVAKIAHDAGVEQATVYQVYVHGPDAPKAVVSVETSTPAAKRFIDALSEAPFFDPRKHTFTSRDLRAVVSSEPITSVTMPIVEPSVDVDAELWQASHVTPSYVGRTFAAALLLSYGMIHNSLLIMIAGLLFTPFMAHALSVGFGAWTRDFRLAIQGVFALAVGAAITLGAGAAIAGMTDAPLRFDGFRSLEVIFLISAVVGVAAGLATADDAGRRPLLGLAAAAQFAIYPAWFGIMLVRGFDDPHTAWMRLLSVSVNTATIVLVATCTYAALGMHGEKLGVVSRWLSGGAADHGGERTPRIS